MLCQNYSPTTTATRGHDHLPQSYFGSCGLLTVGVRAVVKVTGGQLRYAQSVQTGWPSLELAMRLTWVDIDPSGGQVLPRQHLVQPVLNARSVVVVVRAGSGSARMAGQRYNPSPAMRGTHHAPLRDRNQVRRFRTDHDKVPTPRTITKDTSLAVIGIAPTGSRRGA